MSPDPRRVVRARRLNMYLRWMVRSGPVDLGLWTCVDPSHLMLPLDVHSGTQARHINLLSRKANDWRSVEELTLACRSMDPIDPCRYDFAFLRHWFRRRNTLQA